MCSYDKGSISLSLPPPQEPDVEKLEKKINCGQIEEVIFQVGH